MPDRANMVRLSINSRRKSRARRNDDRRGHRISSQSVSDRPRLKIGRCLVIGREICFRAEQSYIATLVERHTRYVMLAKVAGKDTQTVV